MGCDGKTGRYPAEVRERAVRMVFEHQGEYASQWEAIESIAEKLGMSAETLRKWVRQAEIDGGARPGVTGRGASAIKELERENRELRRANEILKAASAFFAPELDPHRRSDERVHRRAPSRRSGSSRSAACLQIAPSTYYAVKARQATPVGAGACATRSCWPRSGASTTASAVYGAGRSGAAQPRGHPRWRAAPSSG